LQKGTKDAETQRAKNNPFVSIDLDLANQYEQQLASVSRKGIRHNRYSSAQKLAVCLHLKKACPRNFEIVGLEVLGVRVPASTAATWWSEFQRDPHNARHWSGSEKMLKSGKLVCDLRQ
jgi:hypothetical protein